jgi:hypothetical protein
MAAPVLPSSPNADNYTFVRIFQLLGCPEFGCFFPLVKSKAKLEALDAMWFGICDNLGWPIAKWPLKVVPEFAIAVEPPALAARLAALRLAPEETAVSTTRPTETALRERNRYSNQERMKHRK